MQARTPDKLTLEHLVDRDAFAAVCRKLSELFSIGIRVYSRSGTKLADICSQTAEHCGYLYSIHDTRVMCTDLVQRLRSEELEGQGKSYSCFSGLRYQALPLRYEDENLGKLIFGPYRPEDLKTLPDSLHNLHIENLDVSALETYQRKVGVSSEKKATRVLELIHTTLETIIHAGFRAHVTEQIHVESVTGSFEELKEKNEQLAKANKRLQQMDELKSNFVATVSHELRTPLTSIIGYSEIIIDGVAGPLSPEQRRYMDTIMEKSDSLLQLIGQILDLARIDAGHTNLRFSVEDPKLLAALAISDVGPMAQKKNIRLETDIAPDVKPLEMDRDKIRRVLTNLLGNAVKFTPEEGSITLRADVVEETPVGADEYDVFEPERNLFLRMIVSDTGIGIPKEKVAQIFDSFFQVDSGTGRNFGGSGLGLSIVRSFVEAHNGIVDVESEEGQGTQFIVKLPYRRDLVFTPAGEPLHENGSKRVAG